jgi:lysozyme
MKTGQAGLKLIKEFEGCLEKVPGQPGRYQPYICPAGVLTIGWGHTNHHGRKFDERSIWTKAECDFVLTDDLRGFERAVERLVKVDLNQNQFDALVSFAYNCGEGNLEKSTLLKKVNARDFAGAAAEFAKWNKGGGKVLRGLVRRREAEAKLFSMPSIVTAPDRVEPPPVPPSVEPMPQKADPPPADKPSIFERLWTWLTASGATGALAFFTDWRVIASFAVALLVLGGAFVWFMGPNRVRVWIRERVNS